MFFLIDVVNISIQFCLFYIAQYQYIRFCLRGLYNLYTYFTSLSQDLTSNQEKLPKKSKKNFHWEKKGKKPAGEQQRRIPVPRWTEAMDVMCTEGSITELENTFNQYDRVHE